MARINDWFKNTFLASFKRGDTRISEKQFRIFEKYLDDDFVDGYIAGVRGIVDGKKITAYEWHRVGYTQYFVEIK